MRQCTRQCTCARNSLASTPPRPTHHRACVRARHYRRGVLRNARLPATPADPLSSVTSVARRRLDDCSSGWLSSSDQRGELLPVDGGIENATNGQSGREREVAGLADVLTHSTTLDQSMSHEVHGVRCRWPVAAASPHCPVSTLHDHEDTCSRGRTHVPSDWTHRQQLSAAALLSKVHQKVLTDRSPGAAITYG